jgi:hypothetical protein
MRLKSLTRREGLNPEIMTVVSSLGFFAREGVCLFAMAPDGDLCLFVLESVPSFRGAAERHRRWSAGAWAKSHLGRIIQAVDLRRAGGTLRVVGSFGG